MARIEINEVVISSAGVPQAARAYTMTTRSGGAASVFAAATGGTLAAQVTDSLGRIEGWLDEGSYNLTVSGYTSYIEAVNADSRLAAAALAGAGTGVGALAARPAASGTGGEFYATDVAGGQSYLTVAGVWVEKAPAASAPLTLTPFSF